MKKFCWDDWKWHISIAVALLMLETVLIVMTYTIGYIMGDNAATRECIEMQRQRKY